MKHETTPAFDADRARLSAQERELSRRTVRNEVHTACERSRSHPSTPWTRGLRVRDIEGAPGVWEMTWCFTGPDGRGDVRVDHHRTIVDAQAVVALLLGEPAAGDVAALLRDAERGTSISGRRPG